MTKEDRKTVVLAVAGSVLLLGDFQRYDALRRRKTRTQRFALRALSPGLSVLHRIDFAWSYDERTYNVSVPMYKELPFSEEVAVIDPAELRTLYTDVIDSSDNEGFMTTRGEAERTAALHIATPLGQVVVPLRFWLAADPYSRQVSFVYDLSQSE